MPTEDFRERLLDTARERARPMGSGPPEPGDLFVLAATAGLPVEWAVLDRRSGEVLAVPADAGPFAGGADVEVPAAAPGGPLSLRCRFGAWLDAGLFEARLRSGSLAPETVAAARRQVRLLESGNLEPSPLAEETDADSEYRDWVRDVPERARALALAARPVRAGNPLREGYRLAAAFALLAVGLGIWAAVLHREVGRLAAPIFSAVLPQEVVLGETSRGGLVVKVPPTETHVLLTLGIGAAVPRQEGRFEIVDAQGRTVWRSERVRLSPEGEFRLVLSRDLLPDGRYRIRIVPENGGRPPAESPLAIVTAP